MENYFFFCNLAIIPLCFLYCSLYFILYLFVFMSMLYAGEISVMFVFLDHLDKFVW